MKRALTAKGSLSEWQESVQRTLLQLGFTERPTHNTSEIIADHEQHGAIRVCFFVPETGKTRLEIAYQDEDFYSTFKKELTGVFRSLSAEKAEKTVESENKASEIPQQVHAEPTKTEEVQENRSVSEEESITPKEESVSLQDHQDEPENTIEVVSSVEDTKQSEEQPDEQIDGVSASVFNCFEEIDSIPEDLETGDEETESEEEHEVQQDVPEPVEQEQENDQQDDISKSDETENAPFSEQENTDLTGDDQGETRCVEPVDEKETEIVDSEFSEENKPDTIGEDENAEEKIVEPFAVKVCKKCGSEMDKKEKVCPQCGEKQVNMPLIIGIIIGVLILLAAGGYFYSKQKGENTSTPTSTSAPVESTQTPEQPKPITDEELPAQEGVVSLEQFNRISEGMKYEEVCGIFGEEGILFQKATAPDENNVDAEYVGYYWEGQGSENSIVVIYFKNGLVEDKDQYGFKE